MNGMRTDFEEVAGQAAPPTRLSADAVYAEAFRRQRRRTAGWVAGGVAVLLVALGAGVGTGLLRSPAQRPAGPEPSATAGTGDGAVISVAATDADHLYAGIKACTKDARCGTRLIGSDDGGATWTVRQDEFGEGDVASPVPGVLLTTVETVNDNYDGQQENGPKATHTYRISTDGGRTWRDVQETTQPVASVPAGGWIENACYSMEDPCPYKALDPAAARLAPLQNQPPVDGEPAAVPASAGFWVAGVDGTGRAAVSVSRDRGRTWSTRPLGSAHPSVRAGVVAATTDGVTAYVLVQVPTLTPGPDASVTEVYRSGDGGQTWQQADAGHTIPSHYVYFNGDAVVAADGTHVVFVRGDGPHPWYAGNGGPYQPTTLTGLGDKLIHTGSHAIVATVGPGLYVAYDAAAVYRSTDGKRFTRVPVDAPR